MRLWNMKEVVAVFGKSKLKFQVLNSTGGKVCYTWESKSWFLQRVQIYQNIIKHSGLLRTGKKVGFLPDILSGTLFLQWWHLHVDVTVNLIKINSVFPPGCLKYLHQAAGMGWCHHSHNHLWKRVFHFRAAGWIILWLPVWSMYDWSFKWRDKSCSLSYPPHPSTRKKKK